MTGSNLGNTARVVEAFYDAARRGDVAGMAAQLAPDVQWTEMAGSSYAGTYRGPDAVFAGVFARLGSEWDGFAAVPEQLHEAGGTVAAVGWYSGTYRKTGKPLRCRVVHVWQVRDGKVASFEQFCDTLLMARATGVA